MIESIAEIFPRVKRTLGKAVGASIRRLRLEKGLSQTVFGERCGFYQTYISRLERGLANPTLNALDVVARTLEVSIFEFFDEVEAELKAVSSRRAKPPATHTR